MRVDLVSTMLQWLVGFMNLILHDLFITKVRREMRVILILHVLIL